MCHVASKCGKFPREKLVLLEFCLYWFVKVFDVSDMSKVSELSGMSRMFNVTLEI